MKALLLLLTAMILCAQPAAPPKAADPVVLTVGAEKITQSMFEAIIESLPEQQRAQLQTAEARRSLAEQLAELKVMAQEGKVRKLDQDPAVKAKLALQTDQVIAAAMYQNMIAAKPDEATERAYYTEHKTDWEEATAKHILIRMTGSRVPLREGHKEMSEEEALTKTKELRAKIVAGAKFAEVAKVESDDVASGENGGDLGSFGRGQMVPEFDESAFTLPVGQVSEPIKTAYGYHLLLVEKRATKSFEEARDEIEQKVRPDMGQKAVEALKAKTPVVYDETYFGKK